MSIKIERLVLVRHSDPPKMSSKFVDSFF